MTSTPTPAPGGPVQLRRLPLPVGMRPRPLAAAARPAPAPVAAPSAPAEAEAAAVPAHPAASAEAAAEVAAAPAETAAAPAAPPATAAAEEAEQAAAPAAPPARLATPLRRRAAPPAEAAPPATAEPEPPAAQAAPEPAPQAAQPAAPPAPAAAAPARRRAAAAAPAEPWAEGSVRRPAAIALPAPGGRVTLEATRALWNRYVAGHAAELGLNPEAEPTRELTDRLLLAAFEFLFGREPAQGGLRPLPEATAAAIAAEGGLARLFDVRLRGDIFFKVDRVAARTYPNPRPDKLPGNTVRVEGRSHVRMALLSEFGRSTMGFKAEDGTFTPVERAAGPVDEEEVAAPVDPGEGYEGDEGQAPEEEGSED